MNAAFTTDGIMITHSALSTRVDGRSSGMRSTSSSTAPQFSSRSLSFEAAVLIAKKVNRANASRRDKVFRMSCSPGVAKFHSFHPVISLLVFEVLGHIRKDAPLDCPNRYAPSLRRAVFAPRMVSRRKGGIFHATPFEWPR